MENNSNIRWRLRWKKWLPLVLFVAPLILEDQILGTLFTPYVYGILMLIVGIMYYRRLGLWQPVVVMIGSAVAIWTYFLAARPEQTYESFKMIGIDFGPYFVQWLQDYWTIYAWLGVLVINAVIFYTLGMHFIKALELEKSAIRLFRLAARELSETQNGFTDRPFQVGEHSFERNELIGLATFLEQKNICVSDFTGSGIRFIFSMGVSPLNKNLREKLSYVQFSEDGKLSVFILENDYRQYRKELTFNQLCELMGKTFLRFVEYYKNHNEYRILTEMKSV